MRAMFCSTALCVILLGPAALAQQGGKPVPLPGVTDDLLPTIIKLVVAVTVIIALIYLSMLLLRKLTMGRTGIMGGTRAIEMLERSHFAPKKFICLMRVGQKVFLLGVTENNINLVADVSDQEFPAPAKNKAKEKVPAFKTYLKQARTHLSTLVSKM